MLLNILQCTKQLLATKIWLISQQCQGSEISSAKLRNPIIIEDDFMWGGPPSYLENSYAIKFSSI